MKPIIKVIFCIIILFNASCDFEWMATDKAYLIRVRNNSNQSVYYYTEYILPDTMLSVNKPHWLREVPSGQQREFYDTEVNDKKFKRLKSGERITLFILDKDIVETHKWEYIRENDMTLKRYEFNYQELIKMGGSIVYPYPSLGRLRFGGPMVNISYDNDYMFFLPGPDGGDRWRTAAAQIQFGPLSLNVNMFTGNPDVSKIDDRYDYTDEADKYYTGLTANNLSMRAGILSVGFGPFRFGRNSEQIRHVFQNRFAHDFLVGGQSKWFLPLPIAPSWFWSFGTGSGNTLW